MATIDDLKSVLVDSLESRGVLGQLKAKVRAEIFRALNDEHQHTSSASRAPPQVICFFHI
jgi:lisH domain-containing protein FOPNL